MSDIAPEGRAGFLTGKLGPLPVWGWGLGLAGLVGAFLWLRNRNTATSTAASATTGSALDTIGYLTTGATNATDTTTTNASGSMTDNQSWLNTAITGVANALTASPLAVSQALNAYLQGGGTLDTTSQSYVNKAISLYGAPPQGVSGASTLAPSSSTTTGLSTGATYEFIRDNTTGHVVLQNTANGKSTLINNTSDWTALQNYLNGVKNGSAQQINLTAGQLANVNSYIAAVS